MTSGLQIHWLSEDPVPTLPLRRVLSARLFTLFSSWRNAAVSY